MKNRVIIFVIAIICIVVYSLLTYRYVYDLKYENLRNTINRMIEDNKKYHVIDSDFSINDEYDLKELQALYQEITQRTFEKLNKEYEESKNDFELLSKENTSLYNEKNLKDFNELVKEGNDKIASYSKSLKYREILVLINDLDDIDQKLIQISNDVQNNRAVVGKAFYNAEKEIDTTNETEKNCFSKQKNKLWTYNKDISKKYCSFLDLNTCHESFIGFTMNNPQAVNKKLSGYTYVSTSNDVFKKNKLLYTNLKKTNNIYTEVYSQTLDGYTIYKYNIIVIPKSYQLSCNFPK